jgi:hypothetical protein
VGSKALAQAELLRSGWCVKLHCSKNAIVICKKLRKMGESVQLQQQRVNAQNISFIASGLFWLVVILSAAFRPCWRHVSSCLAKVRKSKGQPVAMGPMIQMPSALEQYVDQELVLRQTTESSPANLDDEPADELGAFGAFAHLFGMQWIRSTRMTRWSKLSFPLFVALFLILWSLYFYYATTAGKLSEARFCGSGDGFPVCRNSANKCCQISRAIRVEALWPYVQSICNFGLVWFHWRRFTNPVTGVLLHMRNLAPAWHRQCCNFAARLSAVFVVLSVLASIAADFVLFFISSDSESFEFYANVWTMDPPFLFPILMLPSQIMVATFAFIFYIVRHRIRTFLSLVRFAHTSGHSVDHQDVPLMLRTLNCQVAMIYEWTSVSQSGDMGDSVKWLRLQLHRLWMTQIREANTMVNHNRAWLAFQALVVLIQLIIMAVSRFFFRASQGDALNIALLSPYSRLLLLVVCPLSALFLLATTRWYVDRACLQVEAALEAASAASDSAKDASLQKDVCNGEDSLGALLTFCKASSENALQVYGLSIDFMSLIRYVYYVGITFGLAASNIWKLQ